MFLAINEFARDTPWLHGLVAGYAKYGVVLFAVLLLVGWWRARRRGPAQVGAVLWAGAGTLLAVALNQPLANGFHEARPYTDHPQILVLASRTADYGFPSDHAVMAGAVAAGLWLADRRLGLVAATAALLMAFARVYVAAHYPHDVAAGLAFGALVVGLGWLALGGPTRRAVARLTATPLGGLLRARAVL